MVAAAPPVPLLILRMRASGRLAEIVPKDGEEVVVEPPDAAVETVFAGCAVGAVVVFGEPCVEGCVVEGLEAGAVAGDDDDTRSALRLIRPPDRVAPPPGAGTDWLTVVVCVETGGGAEDAVDEVVEVPLLEGCGLDAARTAVAAALSLVVVVVVVLVDPLLLLPEEEPEPLDVLLPEEPEPLDVLLPDEPEPLDVLLPDEPEPEPLELPPDDEPLGVPCRNTKVLPLLAKSVAVATVTLVPLP